MQMSGSRADVRQESDCNYLTVVIPTNVLHFLFCQAFNKIESLTFVKLCFEVRNISALEKTVNLEGILFFW